ncbi:hypothetical protein HMPREF1485_01299 [Propionibacterium sp. HGH0353]|nr:hypothetical protein HMPREF1485_01299 [Propionibacterium sp. HGH0353]
MVGERCKTGGMIVAFSLVPSGGRASREDGGVSDAVAAAVRVVHESGLPNHTSSMFTEIEGSWDEVMGVVKEATEAVAQYGTRVSLVLKADIRPGRTGEMDAKLERLQAQLDKQQG